MQVAAAPSTSSAAWVSRRPTRTAVAARSLNAQSLVGWGGRRQVTASARCTHPLKHSVASAEVLGMGLDAGFGPATRIQKRATPCVRAQAAGMLSSPALLTFAALPIYNSSRPCKG